MLYFNYLLPTYSFLAGLPPLSGYYAKLILFNAITDPIIILVILSSTLAAAYYLILLQLSLSPLLYPYRPCPALALSFIIASLALSSALFSLFYHSLFLWLAYPLGLNSLTCSWDSPFDPFYFSLPWASFPPSLFFISIYL